MAWSSEEQLNRIEGKLDELKVLLEGDLADARKALLAVTAPQAFTLLHPRAKTDTISALSKVAKPMTPAALRQITLEDMQSNE